jgi:hypothetical protein
VLENRGLREILGLQALTQKHSVTSQKKRYSKQSLENLISRKIGENYIMFNFIIFD